MPCPEKPCDCKTTARLERCHSGSDKSSGQPLWLLSAPAQQIACIERYHQSTVLLSGRSAGLQCSNQGHWLQGHSKRPTEGCNIRLGEEFGDLDDKRPSGIAGLHVLHNVLAACLWPCVCPFDLAQASHVSMCLSIA